MRFDLECVPVDVVIDVIDRYPHLHYGVKDDLDVVSKFLDQSWEMGQQNSLIINIQAILDECSYETPRDKKQRYVLNEKQQHIFGDLIEDVQNEAKKAEDEFLASICPEGNVLMPDRRDSNHSGNCDSFNLEVITLTKSKSNASDEKSSTSSMVMSTAAASSSSLLSSALKQSSGSQFSSSFFSPIRSDRTSNFASPTAPVPTASAEFSQFGGTKVAVQVLYVYPGVASSQV